MPLGNPLGYAQQPGPQSLAMMLSEALGGPAQMDPEAMQQMQMEMEMQKYDAMMKQQAAQRAFRPAQPTNQAPQSRASVGGLNPLAPLNSVLGQ